MSQENVEIVRQPIAVKTRSRRRLEERLGLRFPRALAFVAQMVFRMPPRSRLRRATLRRVVQVGFEAINRGDFEAAFALYHPDVEVAEPPEIVNLGLDPLPSGREGRIGVQQRWHAQWGALRFEPEEVIDLGDGRLLVVSRMKGSGLSSGAVFNNEVANLLMLSAGRVIRDQIFLDRGEALEAVGLRE